MRQRTGLLKLNLFGLSTDEKRFVRSEVELWQARIDRHRSTVKKATNDLTLLLNALHVAHDPYHSTFDHTMFRSDEEFLEIKHVFFEPTSKKKG